MCLLNRLLHSQPTRRIILHFWASVRQRLFKNFWTKQSVDFGALETWNVRSGVSSEKLAAVHIHRVPRNVTIVFADLLVAQNPRVLKALKLQKFPSGSFAFAISYTKIAADMYMTLRLQGLNLHDREKSWHCPTRFLNLLLKILPVVSILILRCS